MGVRRGALPGPLVYDSRPLYHDEENYMEFISTPVSSMTEWAQWIARINPMMHYIELMRAVMLKG